MWGVTHSFQMFCGQRMSTAPRIPATSLVNNNNNNNNNNNKKMYRKKAVIRQAVTTMRSAPSKIFRMGKLHPPLPSLRLSLKFGAESPLKTGQHTHTHKNPRKTTEYGCRKKDETSYHHWGIAIPVSPPSSSECNQLLLYLSCPNIYHTLIGHPHQRQPKGLRVQPNLDISTCQCV